MFRFKNPEFSVNKDSVFIGPDVVSDVMLNSIMFESADQNVLKTMMDSMCATYHGISSNDIDIIREGVGDMLKSAWKWFVEIIKKIGAYIKNAFNYLMSYILDFEKFIDKYKDNISKFKEFNVSGFTYTITDEPIDNAGISKVVSIYNSKLHDVEKMTDADITAMIKEELSKETLGKLRGTLSGSENVISADKFVSSMEKKFRNNKSSKSTIKIDSSTLSEYIDNFKNSKKLLEDVKEDGHNVQTVLNDMADFFRSMPQYDYHDSDHKEVTHHEIEADPKKGEVKITEREKKDYSSDYYKKLIKYYNFCYRMCRDIAGIYSKAYTTKIAALKEATEFYKTVIRKALSPFADRNTDESSKESVGIRYDKDFEQNIILENISEMYITDINDYVMESTEKIHEIERSEYIKCFDKYIDEINVLAEGYNKGFILMEDVEVKEKNTPDAKGDSIFKKIIEFIRTLIAKFMDKAKNLFNSNKEWFEKYSHKLDEVTADTYNNIKISLVDYEKNSDYSKLPGLAISETNIRKLETDIKDLKKRNLEEVSKRVFPSLCKLSMTKDLAEGTKIYFRGGSNKVVVKNSGADVKSMVEAMVKYCSNYTEEVDKIDTLSEKYTKLMEDADQKYESSKESSSSYSLGEDALLENTAFAWLPWIDKNGNPNFVIYEADAKPEDKNKDASGNPDPSKQAGASSDDTTKANDSVAGGDKDKKKELTEEEKKQKEVNTSNLLLVKLYYQAIVKVLSAMMTIAEERYVAYIKTLRDVVALAKIAADKSDNPEKKK